MNFKDYINRDPEDRLRDELQEAWNTCEDAERERDRLRAEVTSLKTSLAAATAMLERYAHTTLEVRQGHAVVKIHGVATTPLYGGETWELGAHARQTLDDIEPT